MTFQKLPVQTHVHPLSLPIQYREIHYLERQWLQVVDHLDKFHQGLVKKVETPQDSLCNNNNYYYEHDKITDVIRYICKKDSSICYYINGVFIKEIEIPCDVWKIFLMRNYIILTWREHKYFYNVVTNENFGRCFMIEIRDIIFLSAINKWFIKSDSCAYMMTITCLSYILCKWLASK